ncbi:hypothetical protein P9209_16595 [Prescottella defluvii]|nr:hypothetical protein P9209_16595 [Prescottella defluvii]
MPELNGPAAGYSEPMPLTPAQMGQWLAQQLDPGVPLSVAH